MPWLRIQLFIFSLMIFSSSWGFPWFNKKMPKRPYKTQGRGGICNRHEDIQKQMMVSLGKYDCQEFTQDDIQNVSGIYIIYENGNFREDHTLLNEISYEDFKGMTALKELVIQFSNISDLDEDIFKDLISLESLDLSHNKIKSLPERIFWRLKRLKKLELDSNPYEEKVLPENLFYGLDRLEELDLDEMNLETLHPNTFKTNPNLSLIDLESNNIKFLPLHVFDSLRRDIINEIDLTKNPLDSSVHQIIARFPSGVVLTGKGGLFN